MFLTEIAAGQLAGSQALKADAHDFLVDTVTYGLSLAVIGATLRTRATAVLRKGLSLSLMAAWVMARRIYHTLILGLPSAELMGGIGILAPECTHAAFSSRPERPKSHEVQSAKLRTTERGRKAL